MSKEIQYLSLEEVIEIGEALIPDFRIRDIGLLESAVNRPSTSIYGQEAYESFAEKVAALMHSLASNHALIDGNKRLTWASGRLFAIMALSEGSANTFSWGRPTSRKKSTRRCA